MEAAETSIDLQRGPSAENDPGPGLAEGIQEEVLQFPRGIILSQERGRLDSTRQKVSRQNVGRTDNATTTLHVSLFRGIFQEAAALERDRHCLQRYDEAYGEQGPGDGSDGRHRN